jgi:apolipoprotein N-acyltransferase
MNQTVSDVGQILSRERKPATPTVRQWRICLWLSLLGAAATVGWAPVEQVWVAWVAFAVLSACIVQAPAPQSAFVRCFFFAMGFHTMGHGWVFSALLQQTAAGWFWSVVGSALFLTYLATFLVIPAVVCRWLFQRQQAGTATVWLRRAIWLPAVALAIAWSGAEALRGEMFNGFDSLGAGYLFSAWPLRGWVPVFGVYGCSLLFFASTAIAGAAWVNRGGASYWPSAIPGVFVVLVLTGGAALDMKQWVQSTGNPLSFRLIQGGVSQQEKFNPLERQRQIKAYVVAITNGPADLIVTPETAFTIGLTELDPVVLSTIRSFSAATHSHIFLGMPYLDSQGGERNSMFHAIPGQSELPRYDKTRLMPFGEYAPGGLEWFTRRMSVAMSNLTPGRIDQLPFEVEAGTETTKIGVLTCHEDMSSSDARRWANDVSLLINPANLAWFDGTLALPQRLQGARMRALEIGRPVLRVANTGATAHIDERGTVMAQLPYKQTGVLAGSVQPTTGHTPFARFGSFPAVFLALFLFLCAAVARPQAKQRAT